MAHNYTWSATPARRHLHKLYSQSIKYQIKKKESIYTPHLILAAPIFMETTYLQKLIKLNWTPETHYMQVKDFRNPAIIGNRHTNQISQIPRHIGGHFKTSLVVLWTQLFSSHYCQGYIILYRLKMELGSQNEAAN
jgi:hypothetical protein